MALEQLEMAVPSDQRPCNELKQLKGAWLYSWATLPRDEYVKRLALLFAFFVTTIGGPISYVTFDPFKDVSLFLVERPPAFWPCRGQCRN